MDASPSTCAFRCDDCLTGISLHESRFVVLKEDTSRPFTREERLMMANWYEALVCADCSGWYHGDYFPLLGDE